MIPEPISVQNPTPYIDFLPSAIAPVSHSRPTETPVRRASVKLVYASGKPCLSIQSEGMTTECARMKLETSAAGSIRLAAGKNRVHVSGSNWKAQADRIELGDDGRIVLAGHVKLTAENLGTDAAVTAERLCVEVKAGKFEKIVAQK